MTMHKSVPRRARLDRAPVIFLDLYRTERERIAVARTDPRPQKERELASGWEYTRVAGDWRSLPRGKIGTTLDDPETISTITANVNSRVREAVAESQIDLSPREKRGLIQSP